MSLTLSPTVKRILLAIFLSVLMHGLVLWTPQIKLPKHEPELTTLTAKLVSIPKPKSVHKRKTHNLPPPEPAATAMPLAASEPLATSAPTDTSEPLAASSPLAASEPLAASAPLAASEPVAASAPAATDNEPQHPPLPRHARLHYSVYVGSARFKAGESEHTLDIEDGHYTLSAEVHTTGLVKIFKSYRLEQTSQGTIDQQILKPESFTEVVTESAGKREMHADFDWANHQIHFSAGGGTVLPPQTQDILSILYQFPPLRPDQDSVSINIATSKKIETFRFEIVVEEEIKTALGTLHTVHFRKQHKPGEEGLEIWFALEYRLLPVQVRHLDREGNMDGEAVITDIRVSDE